MTDKLGKDWQVTLDFAGKKPIEEETVFDLIEEYGDYAASAAISPDHTTGSLTITITAPTPTDALSKALRLFSASKTLPGCDVTGFEVVAWADVETRNREPLFPKVVGYAEIARMAGVSRQRAYKFPQIDTFPKPVIETSQGPLYSEAAVAAWTEARTTRAGRPKATV